MRTSNFLARICAALIVLSVITVVAACHKNKSPAPENTSYATDHLITEQSFDDAENIADAAAGVPSGTSMGYRTTATTSSQCATVTHNGDTIIVDFGQKDCLCSDGRYRRGEIITIYTGGSYAAVGSVHTITFDNFYQNDNKVTGTKTVTNMGLNASGQPYFDVSINGAVTLNGGGTITTAWARVRTWIAGYTTLTYQADDVYQVTGSGKMTCTNRSDVTIDISEPLVVANACRWVEAGSVVYSLANGDARTLNYGDTAVCDDIATLTLGNGTVKNITLP